jgi:hypothetical protein
MPEKNKKREKQKEKSKKKKGKRRVFNNPVSTNNITKIIYVNKRIITKNDSIKNFIYF